MTDAPPRPHWLLSGELVEHAKGVALYKKTQLNYRDHPRGPKLVNRGWTVVTPDGLAQSWATMQEQDARLYYENEVR